MIKPKTIRTKLLGTYLIMIILTVLITDLLAYTALKEHYLQERQEAYQIHANVISNYASQYINSNDRYRPPYQIMDYGQRVEARVLLVNRDGVVFNDSFNERWVIGKKLEHNEITAALRGETAVGYHRISPEEWVMYVAVPITLEKQVMGAVLLSTDITDIEVALATVLRRMLIFTLLGSTLALMVGLWLADRLTNPVQDLTSAVQRLAMGTFDQPVPVRSQDELGQLAQSFNFMAERLEQMDRTRRAFVADASHELKSPLSSIKALAESLIYSDERDVAVYREYLQDINEEIDRLNRVVHDLLQLAKMEDAQDINWQQQSIQQVVEEILELVEPQAKAKGIVLNKKLPPDLNWPVNGDLLGTVLLNLIDNGIKYTPEGGSVTLSCWTAGEKLFVQVADTGEGIPPEDLPHIFERFYRVDKARARETGGTGLGLSIVQQSVRVMGGTINVHSTEGVGTIFNVELPLPSKA